MSPVRKANSDHALLPKHPWLFTKRPPSSWKMWLTGTHWVYNWDSHCFDPSLFNQPLKISLFNWSLKISLFNWPLKRYSFQPTSMLSSSECRFLATDLKFIENRNKFFLRLCTTSFWKVWKRYLWPELVMASMVRVALAPAWNRISYSTLISWNLCKLYNQVKVHILLGRLTCQRSQLEFSHTPCSFRSPPQPTSIRLDYQ